MTNFSNSQVNVVEDTETIESDDNSNFNWRSSIRKKFSRLSKKKRPNSLNFDALSSPPVTSDSFGVSSQSLLFPAYENNMRTTTNFSSCSLKSDTENDFVSFQPINSSFKEQSKFYSQGNVNSACHSRHAEDRTSQKYSENQSQNDIKSRFKKLVKKGHLSASISSISTKLRESLQTPYDALLASNLKPVQSTFDVEKERIYQHFRRKKHPSEDKAKDNRKLSGRYSLGVYPDPFANRYEENVWTEPSPITSQSQRTISPLQDVIHSMRHIDSSSEEDFSEDPVSPKNMDVTSTDIVRRLDDRQSCSSDWIDRWKKASTETKLSNVNDKISCEAAVIYRTEFSKIRRDIRENRSKLRACLNIGSKSNFRNSACSSFKDFVVPSNSASFCKERETQSLEKGNSNDKIKKPKSFRATSHHLQSSMSREVQSEYKNHSHYAFDKLTSSTPSDYNYSKCYKFSATAREEAMKLNVERNRKIRPSKILESNSKLSGTFKEAFKINESQSKSSINENLYINGKDSKPSEPNWKWKEKDSKPSLKAIHKEKSESLFIILEKLKDQLNKEKLKGSGSKQKVLNPNFPNSQKLIKSHISFNDDNERNSSNTMVKGNTNAQPTVLVYNQVDKEQFIPDVKSTIIRVHEFDSFVIPEFKNLDIINQTINSDEIDSISENANFITNISNDVISIKAFSNCYVEHEIKKCEIKKNCQNEPSSTNYSGEPIIGAKLDVFQEANNFNAAKESYDNRSNDHYRKNLLRFNESQDVLNSNCSSVNSLVRTTNGEKYQEIKKPFVENLYNWVISSSESNPTDKPFSEKNPDSTEIGNFENFYSNDRFYLKRNSFGANKYFSLENLNYEKFKISDVQKHKRAMSESSVLSVKSKCQYINNYPSNFKKSKYFKNNENDKVIPVKILFESKKTSCNGRSVVSQKMDDKGVTLEMETKPAVVNLRRKRSKRKRRRNKNSKNASAILSENTGEDLCKNEIEKVHNDANLLLIQKDSGEPSENVIVPLSTYSHEDLNKIKSTELCEDVNKEKLIDTRTNHSKNASLELCNDAISYPSKNASSEQSENASSESHTCVSEKLQRDGDAISHQLTCRDTVYSVPLSVSSLGTRPMNEVPVRKDEEIIERALTINYVPEDKPRIVKNPCDVLCHRGHGPAVPHLNSLDHSVPPISSHDHSLTHYVNYDCNVSICCNRVSIGQLDEDKFLSTPNTFFWYTQTQEPPILGEARVPHVNPCEPRVSTINPTLNYAREEVSFVDWESTDDYCDIINEEDNREANDIIKGRERSPPCDRDLVQSRLCDSNLKSLMNSACINERLGNFNSESDRCLGTDVSDKVREKKKHFNRDVKMRSKRHLVKHRTSVDSDEKRASGISPSACKLISDMDCGARVCDNIHQNNMPCFQNDYKLTDFKLSNNRDSNSDQIINEFISFISDIFIYKNDRSGIGELGRNPFWKILLNYGTMKQRKLSFPVVQLQPESNDSKSVRWVLSHGEDLLDFHQVPQNTLLGITRQVDSFNHFFSTAKREADKGTTLLLQEEVSILPSEGIEEAQDLAKNLRRHLSSFADRLHLTKDRLEDTAKCYLLLDKAYEWALEAMKAVGRVKTSGTATPEQVGAAVEAIGGLLQDNPPVPEDTFNAMLDMASKLNNQTLLQQCKMAHARCEETMSLLRSRQAALLKARRQMEFDCQSFVDLNEVLGSPLEESPSLTWFAGTPLNNSGRRRSGCSVGSRPRDPLSRCSSFDTDDDSVFSETPYNSTPSKNPLEAKSSLGGIKELRESDEDLRCTRNFVRSPRSYMRSSAIDFRMAVSSVDPPIILGRSSPPPTLHAATTSAVRAFSSSSSSCSSSDSSGPITGNNLFKEHSRSSWRFSDTSHRSVEEANDSLDESIHPLSPLSNRCSLPSAANSHLLIRGSQINLSNSEDLSNEEVRRNKTLLLIMQELVQTERDYVNSLEYIIENYGPELLRDDIPQALRGQRNVIFGNIEKIFEFHSAYFLRSLEHCQSRPFSVGSIFLKYESQFYLYALYNKNKPKSDDLMSELGSNFFKGKQMELGDKMDLSSYLLKPVQRMGKYALLLKQLLKECDRNEEGFEDLKAAEEMVQFQLRHGNDLLAMDSLRDCDVNLKEQGRLLRQGEFLVSEGNKGKKSLRHVFLFEDLILFSKTKRDPEKKTLDVFQYKQSLKTSDIGLTEQVGDNPLKFEIWFRKRKPSDTFVLQSSSLSMKEAWTEEISKLLWRQALKNRKLRLHEMSSMGIGNKPCLDIRPSEDQINDRSVCMGKAPPRLRLSSSNGLSDNPAGVRRPHSVISVSSSGSSTASSHSSSAGPSFVGTLNLGFESGDSPKPLQRSVTRTSQCSAESGILADLFPERDADENHTKVERSNSTATNTSVDSVLSPSSPLSLSLSPSSHPSSPTTTISPEGSTHPLSRQLLPVEGTTHKTLLTTEV